MTRHLTIPLTVLMVTTSAPALFAQETSVALPTLFLDSALRDERELLDTPVAASVRDREELENQQADTFEELIGDIPGVLIEGGPRGISQEPNIRGFSDDQIVLRFDGGRLNFNQAHRGRFFVDPDIVQRVEVVRGGGSTLFGSGALGGVISVETMDPQDLLQPGQTVGGRFKTGYSSNGEIVDGTVSFFGDWGMVDALVFFGTQVYGTDLEDGNGVNIRNSRIDTANGLLKLGFEPNSENRIELNVSQYQDDGTTPPNANAASTGTTDVNRDAEVQTVRLSWDYTPEDNSLIDLSTLFYGNFLTIEENQIIGGRADVTNYDTIGFEVVNRSQFDMGVPTDLVYGFEVLRDTQSGTRNGAARTQFPSAEANTTGVFVEGTFSLSDVFDLIVGLRYDVYDRDPDDPTLAKANEEFFSPRIGFSYRPNSNWQFFGNLSQAFRAPSLTELYNDGVHFAAAGFPLGGGTFFTGVNNFVPNPNLEEEESVQVDLGTRYTGDSVLRPGDTLSVSANVYYADVKNYIDAFVTFIDFSTAVPGPGGLFVSGTTRTRNIDAELWGFEAELDYDAGAWFASAGLTIPRGQAAGGQNLGSIPQDRLTTTVGIRPNASWTLGARATFAAKQSDVPTGSTPGEAYELLDLFAIWEPDNGPLEDVVFRAGIDNLFDEQYMIYPNGLAQPGRSFKISASVPF